jgi:hypothetical protein
MQYHRTIVLLLVHMQQLLDSSMQVYSMTSITCIYACPAACPLLHAAHRHTSKNSFALAPVLLWCMTVLRHLCHPAWLHQMPTGTGKTITLLSLITSYQLAHPEVMSCAASGPALCGRADLAAECICEPTGSVPHRTKICTGLYRTVPHGTKIVHCKGWLHWHESIILLWVDLPARLLRWCCMQMHVCCVVAMLL